jgi:hypothetical protein
MTVLKYSDLVDSGLFVKTSTKGQPLGVASLDTNGLVYANQLPAGTGGTGTQGIQGIQGISGGGGTTSSSVFRLKVLFTGGNVSSVDSTTIPTGWSLGSISAPNVTINHNVGKMPMFISFLGYDPGVSALRYRNTTANVDMKVPTASLTSSFTFQISSLAAQTSDDGYAYVNIAF